MNFEREIFDQCAFEGSAHDSARRMRVLRNLRKHGPTTEGTLATKCGEKIFLQEWAQLIAGLVGAEYVTSELSGRGLTKLISLTEKGEQFMEYRVGPKPEPVAETQPTE